MSRLPAMQAWPWLWKMANAEPLTAAGRLASSKTMLAPLPPSSSCTRLRLPAEASTIRRPTAVEPVKAILLDAGMLGQALAGGVAVAGHDVDDAGREADLGHQLGEAQRATAASARLGFSTTVLPAASAGPIFQLLNISGKFHGTIWPTTPSGSRLT